MQPFKKVAFHTLGCKLNFSETSTIARQFQEAGYARVEWHDRPDIFVLNTCSVTENADKKCKQVAQKAKKINPEAAMVVIGCYAQLKPEEVSSIEGVDLVLGANEKFNVVEWMEEVEPQGETVVHASHIKEAKAFNPSFSYGDRTRSFLKVQDGCDYFCSFCTIPLARGRSRSASLDRTLEEAQRVAATEVKEVVLTGVNIGDFGKGSDESFLDLVRELDHVEGIDRFRISSIEPDLLNEGIIEHVAQSRKFVPHFHIPLQSGSDHILQKMRRRYDTDLYRQRVGSILSKMPDCSIGVDVITGTPGETEEEFEKTYRFLHELPVSYLHVFTYSERANTSASRMGGKVPWQTRKERSKMLRSLSAKKQRKFYEDNLGSTRRVLFEAAEHEGSLFGFTENYIKTRVPFDENLINQTRTVRLDRIGRDGNMEIEWMGEPEKELVH